MSKYNQVNPYLHVVPVTNSIAYISGLSRQPLWSTVCEYGDDEKNLSNSMAAKDIVRSEIIVTVRLAEMFLFRRIYKAAELVRQYQDCFSQTKRFVFVTVYRMFYSGLVAFDYFRETKDQYWMEIGKGSIGKMESLMNECKWNFESKWLILQAEYHSSIDEFDKAGDEYNAAINSAHAHRFINEEAIANELAAYFQRRMGRQDISEQYMERANECYLSWGAVRKAESLIRDTEPVLA